MIKLNRKQWSDLVRARQKGMVESGELSLEYEPDYDMIRMGILAYWHGEPVEVEDEKTPEPSKMKKNYGDFSEGFF